MASGSCAAVPAVRGGGGCEDVAAALTLFSLMRAAHLALIASSFPGSDARTACTQTARHRGCGRGGGVKGRSPSSQSSTIDGKSSASMRSGSVAASLPDAMAKRTGRGARNCAASVHSCYGVRREGSDRAGAPNAGRTGSGHDRARIRPAQGGGGVGNTPRPFSQKRDLKNVGVKLQYVLIPREGGEEETLRELRNCACRSSAAGSPVPT